MSYYGIFKDGELISKKYTHKEQVLIEAFERGFIFTMHPDFIWDNFNPSKFVAGGVELRMVEEE